MVGVMIAGVVVLFVVIGAGCWWVAVLTKRVETEHRRADAAESRLQQAMSALQLVREMDHETTAWFRAALDDAQAAGRERETLLLEALEKLTVAPPTPDSSPPDLPLTDRDPTEAMEDSTDWTDGLTFGSLGPTTEFGAPAPGMPTAEDMQRGGA